MLFRMEGSLTAGSGGVQSSHRRRVAAKLRATLIGPVLISFNPGLRGAILVIDVSVGLLMMADDARRLRL